MAVSTDRQSVAANAVVANALSGKLYEFVTRPSIVRLYATASAVGLNMTFLVGGVAILSDQEVNAQNRMPIVPDDFVVEAMAPAGTRLLISYRNTTAGAITAFSRVDLIPVG
jgi:hypothetical protein